MLSEYSSAESRHAHGGKNSRIRLLDLLPESGASKVAHSDESATELFNEIGVGSPWRSNRARWSCRRTVTVMK